MHFHPLRKYSRNTHGTFIRGKKLGSMSKNHLSWFNNYECLSVSSRPVPILLSMQRLSIFWRLEQILRY